MTLFSNPDPNQFAYVTLVTTPEYVPGAVVLAYSLSETHSPYQRVVLYNEELPEDRIDTLRSVFHVLIPVTTLHSKDLSNLSLLGRPDLHSTFTKVYAWKLTQFKKCVFLDADILVLSNIDDLFLKEELSAAPDCGWPDIFNSGVFVFKPSLKTFDKLYSFAKEYGSWDGGDQGLLNTFFSDWSLNPHKRLPFIYNVTPTSVYSYAPAFVRFRKDIKVVHFAGMDKPWTYHFFTDGTLVPKGHLTSSTFMELIQHWWDVYASYQRTQGISSQSSKPSFFSSTFSSSSSPYGASSSSHPPYGSGSEGMGGSAWGPMSKYEWPVHEFDTAMVESLKNIHIGSEKRRSSVHSLNKEVSPTYPARSMQQNFDHMDPDPPISSTSSSMDSSSSPSSPTKSKPKVSSKPSTSTSSSLSGSTKLPPPSTPSSSTKEITKQGSTSPKQSVPSSSEKSSASTPPSETTKPAPSSTKSGFGKFFGKK